MLTKIIVCLLYKKKKKKKMTMINSWKCGNIKKIKLDRNSVNHPLKMLDFVWFFFLSNYTKLCTITFYNLFSSFSLKIDIQLDCVDFNLLSLMPSMFEKKGDSFCSQGCVQTFAQ